MPPQPGVPPPVIPEVRRPEAPAPCRTCGPVVVGTGLVDLTAAADGAVAALPAIEYRARQQEAA